MKRKLKEKNNLKNGKKKNKLAGKCVRCSCLRIKTSNNYCEKHYLEDVSHKCLNTRKLWWELKRMLETQNYKCYYSGVELVLGVNASIDHTKPSIKYPELKHDINNLKWVDIKVNRMKRELEENEFKELCKLISTTPVI